MTVIVHLHEAASVRPGVLGARDQRAPGRLAAAARAMRGYYRGFDHAA